LVCIRIRILGYSIFLSILSGAPFPLAWFCSGCNAVSPALLSAVR
jgi:hypothetical protein